MSLLTNRQVTTGKGRARMTAGAARARHRARGAAKQAAPLAASARLTARQGVHSARTWAAPRIERSGHTLQQRVAPRMAAVLSATARRVDPAPRKRRRWPFLAAGLAAAALSAIAAYMLNRRGPGLAPEPSAPETGASSSAGPAPSEPKDEAKASDVNGRVRTS